MTNVVRHMRIHTFLQSGPRMLTGLALAVLGTYLSFPVLIGQNGGMSWWPAMVFVGISWFLLGVARLAVKKLA